MFKTFLATAAVLLLVVADASAGVRVRVNTFRAFGHRASVSVNVGSGVVARGFLAQRRVFVAPQAVIVTPQFLVPQQQFFVSPYGVNTFDLGIGCW